MMRTVEEIDTEIEKLAVLERAIKSTDPELLEELADRAATTKAATKKPIAMDPGDDVVPAFYPHRDTDAAARVSRERRAILSKIDALRIERRYAAVKPGRTLEAIRADMLDERTKLRAAKVRLEELKAERDVAIELAGKNFPRTSAGRAASEIALRGIPSATKFGRMG